MSKLSLRFKTTGVKDFTPLDVTVTHNGEEMAVEKMEWMGQDVTARLSANQKAWVEYQAWEEIRQLKE